MENKDAEIEFREKNNEEEEREDQKDIIEPFKISRKGLDNLMQKYLNRTLDEELDFIESKGGIQWFEESLQTNFKDGISENEVLIFTRKKAFDSNEQEPEPPLSFWQFVKEALGDRIIQILAFAAVVEIALETGFAKPTKRHIAWIDGFAIVIAILVVVLVGSINNYYKEKEFRELKDKNESSKEYTLRREGQIKTLKADNILVGDILKVEEGMNIPADGILIEGNNITIDESAMTGETDMIEKDIYSECIQQRNKYYATFPQYKQKKPENQHHKIKSPIISSGTQISSGNGWIVIICVGPNSQNGKILSQIESNKHNDEGTPLQQKLNAIADFIGTIGLCAAILTSIGMSISLGIMSINGPPENLPYKIIQIFIIGITVIVVSIPEGLPLAVTLSLAFSIKKMLQDNNLVRRMEACETMGGANYICTDKTGTLTKNEMDIVRIYDGVKDIDLSKLVDTKQNAKETPKEFFSPDYYELFKFSAACNTGTEFDTEGNEKSTFKTDLAFTKILKKFNENIVSIRDTYIKPIRNKIPRIPFSSKRKKMSTIITSKEFPQGYRMLIKGGSEIVLPSCKYYRDGDRIVEITPEKRVEFEKKIDRFAELTLRTVIIGYKELNPDEVSNWEQTDSIKEGLESREVYRIEEGKFVLIGIIGIMDLLKAGVKEAVADCKLAQIKLIMVTGDNINTAVAIAKNCNIMEDKQKAMLGEAFSLRCGGVVCENCFKTESYINALNEAKKNYTKPEYYKVALKCSGYKCSCYRTAEEGITKLKNRFKMENIERWKEAQQNEERRKIMEDEIQEMVDKEIEQNPIKIKKDVIANIEKFEKMVAKISVIARSQPLHKYILVTGLKQLENVVAVTGDGTNDATALSKADVGFAMNNGTDIAKEASDIIIIDNSFSSIVNSVLWGRNIYDNIRKFLQFQLSVNVVACVLVFIGASIGQTSPLQAIQMLWVNMIMDSFGSLALATESPHRFLLDRKPADRNEFIVNKKMFKHIIGQSIFQLTVLLLIVFFGPNFILENNSKNSRNVFAFNYCMDAGILIEPSNVTLENYDIIQPKVHVLSGMQTKYVSSNRNFTFPDVERCNQFFRNISFDRNSYNISLSNVYNALLDDMHATTHYTFLFNTFVNMNLINQICCRELHDRLNIFWRIETNKLFLLIMAIELGCQALIVQVSGKVFHCVLGGLNAMHWGMCIGFAAITFFVNILLKYVPDSIFVAKGSEEKPMSQSKILAVRKDQEEKKDKNNSMIAKNITSIKKGNSRNEKKESSRRVD